ncbi:MAG: hypothetical protein IT209_10060 [Armatimonadetes bacterium]|nr:hypothetical protein [Armatimonadota bacterium]
MYNPYAIRRCVRRQSDGEDGVVRFKTKSFTGRRRNYYPIVNTRTGAVSCNCPDFRYRCESFAPTVATKDAQCKHLRRAIARLRRLHLLKDIAQPSLAFQETPEGVQEGDFAKS